MADKESKFDGIPMSNLRDVQTEYLQTTATPAGT